jgi:ribosome biogenesis GTPase A
MTTKLAIFGGCSNSGKTTLIGELSKRYDLEQAKKFELIRKEAAKKGMAEDKLFENFLELEMIALKSIRSSVYDKPFLLDSHYAIQPQIDDALARGIVPTERIEEPYVLSFGEDTLREIAENLTVDLFYVYTDLGEIVSRRTNNLRNYYVPQRSLDPENILHEINEEHGMFLKTYNTLKDFGGLVKRYEIENRKGKLEETIGELARHLNLEGEE